MVTHASVGVRTKRIDSPRKLTGQERFTGDLRFPGQLFARPVGSPYAHAYIKNVNKEPALAIPGVVAVLTANDLPIARDEHGNPVKVPIAFDEVLYAGQFVALVLAENDAAAQDGAAAVEVDYDPLDVVTTLDQAMDPSSPKTRITEQIGGSDEAGMHNADAAQEVEGEQEQLPPNVSNSIHFERGDVEQGFAEADTVVDLTFDSQTVHQGYIETQAALAVVDPLGDMQIYTSTQAAFHCRNRVAETVSLPIHRVNVVPMPVGGGFGGKFVLIEPLVAAAAVAVQRPVLLQFTRMEDFLSGNPAPDCRIQLKVGAKKDGTLTALQSRMIFDAGATGSSPMQIGAVLMGGYYRVPNLLIRGYEVMTNKTGAGAYRAPGAQQGTLAIESVMDELARKLKMDPLALRLHNCVVEGDPRPNGSPWPKIGLKETLEALQAHPMWKNREQAHAEGKGIGIACGGWPGGVEPSTAICRLDADGNITVVLGSVDLNGTNTTFAQIAAEAFGMPLDGIQVTTASTDAAPYAGGTGGSKITYTVGPSVKKAAEDARQQVLNIAAQHLEASPEDLEISEGMVKVKGVPSSGVSLKQIASMSMTFGGKYEPVYGRGSSAITDSAPGFAAHLAQVEVDDLTGETKVTGYVAVQDVGFAINPATVEAQVHGGVAQGIGWGLYEGLDFDDDGQLLTASLMDYALPKAQMIPDIDVVLVEVPSEHGAYGSKGVGEPPAIPGAAAVANAVRDATGIRVTQIPIRPRILAEKLWNANGGSNGHA
ncbi:MAG TPA: xanthine dehydrogenase family protein molybdopterin-binding subunit [Thermomicrobiales bacterium]|nr:xanthine dehydrogenase family protein molybdopterin-binding subunit [Thermomicrobiales bacterium]